MGHLLGHVGEDQPFLRHGSGIAGYIKLFIQNLDLHGEFCGFLVEFAEAGDLPSQPPVVKVFDLVLQVHEVAAGPEEKGAKPGGNWFDGVFLTMPNHVSLCIQVDNIRGLIRALSVMIASDSAVFQPLDPFGGAENSVTDGDVEVGHSPVVFDIAIGGLVKCVLVVLDTVVEPANLFFKAADLSGLLGVVSSNGCEEPFSNGSQDVCIEIRVGCQGGCNCIGRHRWFQALDQSDWERDVVLGGRGI